MKERKICHPSHHRKKGCRFACMVVIEMSRSVSNPLVLTFDVGTQSARVVLVDAQGNILDKVKKVYQEPYYSKYPNWAEQSPQTYWEIMCSACRELKQRQAARWDSIIAVTCTCIRGSAVCFDENGEPVRDAILWLDKRRATGMPPLSLKTRTMFRAARLTDTIEVLRSGFYCNWLALNEPETWAKTKTYGLLSTYYNVKFTGILTDSNATMCGILPYDTKNHSWYPKSDFHRELYLIDDSRLFELVKPGTVLGGITEQAARETGIPQGLPFVVTGSDKMCETLGLSCTTADTAAISLGTLSSIQVPSRRFFTMQMVLPPFPSLTGDFLNELQTYRGFWLVSWFKEQFGQKEVEAAGKLGVSAEQLLDEQLGTVPPGCDGLIMQPTLTPEAVTPHARGVFLGLTEVHTRMHFYRAIVEGISFILYDGLKALEKAGKTEVMRAFIAGGGSNSPYICQIVADVSGLPIYRIQTGEASGLGSSILAFVSLGVFPDIDSALAAMVHEKDHFDPDPQVHALYKRMYYQIYHKMFPRLVKLYRTIYQIFIN